MFVQPSGGCKNLRHRNHSIVFAVTVEHGNVQFRNTTVGRCTAGNDSWSKEAGKRNRRGVPFRMNAQQLNRQQTALRKTDRHYSTIFGNIVRNPIVDGLGGGIRVTIQIFAGRHAIMEPRVRALAEAEFTGTGLLQHERRAQ